MGRHDVGRRRGAGGAVRRHAEGRRRGEGGVVRRHVVWQPHLRAVPKQVTQPQMPYHGFSEIISTQNQPEHIALSR